MDICLKPIRLSVYQSDLCTDHYIRHNWCCPHCLARLEIHNKHRELCPFNTSEFTSGDCVYIYLEASLLLLCRSYLRNLLSLKMSTFLRHNSLFLGGLGMGLLVGVGGSVIYFRLTTNVDTELRLISESISSLRREVEELKEKIATRRRRSPALYSGTASSSGETDDEAYEDAYGG